MHRCNVMRTRKQSTTDENTNMKVLHIMLRYTRNKFHTVILRAFADEISAVALLMVFVK